MTKLLIALGVAVITFAGIWWFLREPPLQANEIMVTFDSGKTCRWQDWSFRVRREVQNNTARGNVLVVGRATRQVRSDTTLRVFSADGEKLAVAPSDLLKMELRFSPDDNSTSNNQINNLVLTTRTGAIRFPATRLPKFSRSRVLVPVASHYYSDQSDDYMSWGNSRISLAGTIPPDCTGQDEITLTGTRHSAGRTPVEIQFSGL